MTRDKSRLRETTGSQVRRKYLEFFKAYPRNHKEISPAPLVVENDPSTLFTSAGMQPLIPYLMGETHPEGRRLVNSQPCVRTVDIDEVGDGRHLTFFEMLGNWSLGDPESSDGIGTGYFKKEQLAWIWEFFTKELSLPKDRLWVSVFAGDSNVPKDIESFEIWKNLGVPEERIRFYGADKNWWSRSGVPEKMPIGEIGGPDSEVYYEFIDVRDEKYGREFHPDSERFLEIGNSVFIQYKKTKGGLEELSQKNVDFGGGLERIVMAINDEPDIFKSDFFAPVIKKIEEVSGKKYSENAAEMRIIADHIRAATFLILEGVEPSNKLQGYVLRRLIRRAMVRLARLKKINEYDVVEISRSVENSNKMLVDLKIGTETSKFAKTLDRGIKEIEKISQIDGKKAFDLYQSYGFPLELTQEIFEEKGQKVDRKEFEKEFKKHQELSRTASIGVFKGGLADHSKEVIWLHTATHLLHAALRKVLGEEVTQKGSNITADRLRFDFTFSRKLSLEEIKKVEDLVNEQIDKDLPVSVEIKTLEEAKKEGALANFKERYGEKVKVYTIGDPPFSREVCGGPHVKRLSEIHGHVKITKEESVSSGVRRIYSSIKD